MIIRQTEWNEDKVKEVKEWAENRFVFFDKTEIHQPEFSFSIGWNEPRKIIKPYFEITLWNINIKFGWLWD